MLNQVFCSLLKLFKIIFAVILSPKVRVIKLRRDFNAPNETVEKFICAKKEYQK